MILILILLGLTLEVIFNVMRSINPRFTYLLTYLLTYSGLCAAVKLSVSVGLLRALPGRFLAYLE